MGEGDELSGHYLASGYCILFSLSVDELLNAKQVMDKQKIRKQYVDFAERFSKETFEIVLKMWQRLMKYHYDDDNLLLQMSILLLNHAQMAVQSEEIFEFVVETLQRVEDITNDVWIQRQANALIATTSLFKGEPSVALERLDGSILPALGEEMTLAQAHEALGQTEEAKRVLQVMIYQHIVTLIGSSPLYLKLTIEEDLHFFETIKRIEGIIDLYQIEQLHPNMSFAVLFCGCSMCCTQKR